MPEFGAMHKKKEFPFKLKFKYDSGAPAVKLDVITDGGTSERILSSEKDKPLFFKNNKYILAFQEKPEEVKDYKSTLEIFEEEKPVKTQIVEVNHPLVYKGFYFYQANYNPENPDYSGIQVVRDPGVFIVYFGFLVLILGLIYIFYLKSLFKKE
ncbi:cytochrome c biogenesis protein ResB [bacterium]|nr:cytochrome c biogenesis protein ResB [bacterium]